MRGGTDDAIHLCDVLSSFSSQAEVTLHELCRVMGLPGKPGGISGGEVEKHYREGRIREIADYCETDVVNTYRAWLRHELCRENLTNEGLQMSEADLSEHLKRRGEAKLHLANLITQSSASPSGEREE